MAFQNLPRARREGLVIQPIEDEIILYDPARDETHLLNQTAVLVWQQCDGKHTIATIAANVAQATATQVSEELVRYTLAQLQRKRLLVEQDRLFSTPITRREFLSKFAIAAALVPVIQTIKTPTNQAASCAGAGEPCILVPCCPGLNCDGICY
jgi:hypothetical protein